MKNLTFPGDSKEDKRPLVSEPACVLGGNDRCDFFVQREPQLAAAGALLLAASLLLGVLRVISGVHYISDVAAALVCAGIGWASYGIWL